MDIPLRWHLGPMEEEEVHPHPAAAKHPVPGPGISPVGETSWRGATPGKAVQEAVVSPPPHPHYPHTLPDGFQGHPQAVLLHPFKVKAKVWE